MAKNKMKSHRGACKRMKLTASDQDIDSLMQELIASHTLG